MIDWLPNGLVRHSLPRPSGLLRDAEVVADIGCGVRPVTWGTPKARICVDPHEGYLKVVQQSGFPCTCVRATAREFLEGVKPGSIDVIYLLDVIEHMDKPEGREVLRLAMMAQPRQIVVFTPHGYLEQEERDPWELGGDRWQKHRSGWLPEEFPGWATSTYGRGFYAMWTNGNERVLAV